MNPELRIHLDQQMHVVGPYFKLNQLTLQFDTDLLNTLFQASVDPIEQDRSAVLGAPVNLVLTGVHPVSYTHLTLPTIYSV